MSELIRERVVQVLRRVLGPDVDLDDTRLELESLKMLEVIVGLENEFELSIPEEAQLAQVTSSVDEIVTFMKKLQR